MSDPSEPRQPPRPPRFTPPDPTASYPPTSEYPQVSYPPAGQPGDYGAYPPPHDPATGYPRPDATAGYPPPYGPPGAHPPHHDPGTGYPPQGPPPPGYGPPQRPPRKSSAPLIFVVLVVSLLLCGGVVVAGKILIDRATQKAEELAEPILNPTLPALPTGGPDLPGLPTDFPDLPGLPTDLPSGVPGLGQGPEITVTYEVTGDGPAEVVYADKQGNALKRISNATLPWKITTKMNSPALISVVALRTDLDSGSISCRATVNSQQVAEQTAEGRLSSASCYNFAAE